MDHKTSPKASKNTVSLPAAFVRNIRNTLGETESIRLFEALGNASPISVRYNPYKLRERPTGENVPWCRYGYYLPERPRFTLDPLFHAGAYYVQEASSMFLETLLRQSADLENPLRILDLCASPGGKTTLLSTLAGPEGLVVANETVRSRTSALIDNVKKWGIGNMAVTHNDPAHFTPYEHYFDVVVVDAPCSGEGMFRKNDRACEEWSEANVKLCAARQRRILEDVWNSLRPGGILIYSTCTFNRVENEENLEWLTETYDCEPVPIEIDPGWGITRDEVNGFATFRFYPHRLRGEGFFATLLRKGDGRLRERTPKPRRNPLAPFPRQDIKQVAGWFNQPEYMQHALIGEQVFSYYATSFREVAQLSGNLNVIYSGIHAGQLFGSKLKPEHPLAFFHDVNRSLVSETDLNLEQALAYLRKNELDPDLFAEGLNLVAYQGLPLGWMKRIGRRVNNLYPKELRIAVL